MQKDILEKISDQVSQNQSLDTDRNMQAIVQQDDDQRQGIAQKNNTNCITIKELLKYDINQVADLGTNNSYTIKGWVKSKRESKGGFSFLMINDGSTGDAIQVIANNTMQNYSNEILCLTKDCAVIIIGRVVASNGKGQQVEMQAESIEVLGFVAQPETYPVSPKKHSLEYLREFPHLRIRTKLFSAVMRIRNTVSMSIHNYLQGHGFYWMHTPIITTNDCEGAGDLFRVTSLNLNDLPFKQSEQIISSGLSSGSQTKTANTTDQSNNHDYQASSSSGVDYTEDFFTKEAFLTVSGQLNAEAYCLGLSKVYTFGPTFRAEKSNTTRHLAEFWMVEPEVAFANLQDNITLATQLINHIFKTVLDTHYNDLLFLQDKMIEENASLQANHDSHDLHNNCLIARLESIIASGCEVITYTKAVELLSKYNDKFEAKVYWGIDLSSEHERFLCEQLIKKLVVVTDYPKDIKAFYMRQNDDGKTVAAMDVLAPGIGEIIGGSQREERYDLLLTRINQLGINKTSLEWYLDLRRFGTVAHAGFGLGLERLISYISGLTNIRDTIAFPRANKSAIF